MRQRGRAQEVGICYVDEQSVAALQRDPSTGSCSSLRPVCSVPGRQPHVHSVQYDVQIGLQENVQQVVQCARTPATCVG
eukprot:1139217-Pelagomonas_calceolata.AAC.2